MSNETEQKKTEQTESAELSDKALEQVSGGTVLETEEPYIATPHEEPPYFPRAYKPSPGSRRR